MTTPEDKPAKVPKFKFAKVKEKPIQDAIIKYLQVSGYVVWRVPVQGLVVASGDSLRMMRNPLRGFPDIQGILKDGSGRAFYIECKSTTGRLRAEQKQWQVKLEATGSLVMVARDLISVIVALKEYESRGFPNAPKTNR